MRKHLSLSRLFRETEGGAAVELGIIFPIFTVLVLGVIEYGMAIFQIMNVSHAAQVGAQFAMLKGYNVANIQAAVTAATGIAAGNVTVTEQCGCAAAGPSLTVTSCGPPLPPCGGGQQAGAYVTVNVRWAYSPAAPGIPSPLVAQTVVRVQ
jgi:Flp pilus assembly protein TadG